MKLGEIIKQYRLKNDLSQRQFAKMCGISNGYISMLEEGKHPKTGEAIVPSLAMFKKLSAAMGITVNELMSRADESDVALNLQPFAATTVEIKTRSCKKTPAKKNKTRREEESCFFMQEKWKRGKKGCKEKSCGRKVEKQLLKSG